MELYNIGKPGFHDLVTANKEPIHAGMIVVIVMYSIRTGVKVISHCH